MKNSIQEHEEAIKSIEKWIETDKQIMAQRIKKQEDDLLYYKMQLEKAKRKGLKGFERYKFK